ncbi:hypothetical protein PGTUg99_032795 [Puccinia graminis f. sp. tritici]|uniref:Uncharacterized protein n=1 Tax=Puccinia graminis f. sp. tritici TaxID=56615 RepID=A0A5B0MG40_PUCGR|nr:hypothetical protein PGTUg99_032795 [Puccinia graminis f. sp. tritici]
MTRIAINRFERSYSRNSSDQSNHIRPTKTSYKQKSKQYSGRPSRTIKLNSRRSRNN